MHYEFELAFTLLDEAADRIRHEQYGTTRILFHTYGPLLLSTHHTHTPEDGHRLLLTAHDDDGHIATIEATTADLAAEARTRILTVRAGHLTFEATDTDWTFQATDTAGTTHTLTAEIGADPMWTVTTGHSNPVSYHDLQQAIAETLSAAA